MNEMQTNKKQCSARLASFQECLSLLETAEMELLQIHDATEKVSAKITKIGMPVFSDDNAIEELARARIKLAICEGATGPATQQLDRAVERLRALINRSADLVYETVLPAYETRIDEIAEALAPNFNDAYSARQAAKTCASGCSAAAGLKHFALVNMSAAGCFDAERIRGYANEYVEVLRAACADNPDLQRFVNPKQQEATA